MTRAAGRLPSPRQRTTRVRTVVAEALRAQGLAGAHVLAAVSGGIDSVVLLDALLAVRRPLGLRISVAHVHHGLRGEEADEDARFVERLAAARGLAVASARVDPQAIRRTGPSRQRPTLEEAARRLRAEALRKFCAELGADVIATAHHADDQAETVLLRLLRGSGPDGLGGIAERSPDRAVVRPLLAVPRSAIEAYARAAGLRWREDASNFDRAFARNRVRHDWLPALDAAFAPGLLQRIADLAEAQRRDTEWIAGEVASAAARLIRREENGLRLERDGWDELPEALARRLARHALQLAGSGRDVSRVHLGRMLGQLRRPRSGTVLELPGSLVLRCDAGGFRLAHCGRGAAGAC